MESRVALVIFVLLLIPNSYGQQIEPPTDVEGEPIDSIGFHTATRPVQGLSKNLLNSASRYHVSDSLNSMGGVQARLEGSPLLSIRGSQSSARVLALQDGIPLNFSDGVGFNPLFIATENLDGVSLLKGPAFSIFGRDAMAGAIEFNSEKLKQNKFYISQGSFNTNRLFAGAPIEGKKYHIQITAYETHSDGNFPYKIPRGTGTAIRQRNDSETLRSTVLASGENGAFKWKTFHLIARQIGSTPDSIDSNFPIPFNNWGEMSSLVGQIKISNPLEIGLRTSYKTLTLSSDPSSNSLATSTRQGLSLISKSENMRIEIFDDFSFEYFQASYLPAIQNVNINEFGAQAEWQTGGKFMIEPAIRASTENGGFSPSLGFSRLGEGDWKYFLNYSEGYSPASITQKYAQFQGFVGNPNLQEEHSSEIDLGFEKSFREYFIHFETFGRDLQNLIQNTSVNGSLTPQNVGRARAYGFEFQGKREGYFNTGLSLAYLSNRKLDVDAPVLLSPQIQGSLFIEKEFQKYSLTLQDTQWTSYYDLSIANQSVQLNGWNSLDLFFHFNIVEGLHGEIALLNILDQAKELHIGYPEPQASYTFSLIGYL